MLQVKDLVKKYTTKGETVVALDGVSVTFPERGMVFLLGKSGSGKSTLLNISGGLDAPDEGEVIVKGKSSKDFTKSDFDSYRNTYVGFIFQEYNILDELTVAENVALAIELQGKPRDHALVEKILEEVDLGGLGNRRPNTLSGGQKQRVAIARALVKDPEIIMADEPTGALDSATGAQVFDTLKKLSAEKLVVVVSHDREFAETYADRIIELSDGKIVADISRGEGASVRRNLTELSERKLSVTCGSALTDGEIEKIVSFLKKNKGGVVISSEKTEVLASPRPQAAFRETEAAPERREENTASFLKSKFPIRYALKMGVSGLRFKPVRLAFTTLLAVFSFLVFGFFSTLVTFDTGKIAATALTDSAAGVCVLTKSGLARRSYPNTVVGPDGTERATEDAVQTLAYPANFLDEDVERLRGAYPEMDFDPVFNLGKDYITYSAQLLRDTITGSEHCGDDFHDRMYYRGLTGFIDASVIAKHGHLQLLAGRLPAAADEVVLSEITYEVFAAYGFSSADEAERTIAGYGDLIGKKITIYLGLGESDRCEVTVSGIVSTGEDFSEYEYLKEEFGEATSAEISGLEQLYMYSYSALAFVHSGFYDSVREMDDCIGTYLHNFSQRYDADFDPRFVGSRYREESASANRYVYLFSCAQEDRAARCDTLLGTLNRSEDAERDIRYGVPYSFMTDISHADRIVGELFPILGSAAAVLALFSALLLFNFISASINAKKKDIGILRAVGARGIDVFKIFIVEALTITLFCFVLGSLGGYLVASVVNAELIARGIVAFPLFLFGGLNVLFVLGIAFLTAIVATSIPVGLTVRKKPVEAIRAI